MMTTPEGYRLGTGEGTHDMARRRPDGVFSWQYFVRFRRSQPNRIFPALKGIVDGAQGGVGGEMRFGWTPKA
ncbi:MAG: hypothetical protein R3C58_01520 [Parvularculaceae bacterium]